jgi:hypothetical protein
MKCKEVGRFEVERWRARRERVWAWVWRDELSDSVTRRKGQYGVDGEKVEDLLFDTSVCTAVSCAYSGSSGSMDLMRSFKSRRYRGQRCTIVKSQSRSLSFPQQGCASCVAMKAAKAGFGVTGERRTARDEIVVWKDVMNGV